MAVKKYAVETEDGWVPSTTSDSPTKMTDWKKWFEGICYFRVNAQLPIRTEQTIAFSCSSSIPGAYQSLETTTGIARMLGVSRASVIPAIDYLTTMNAKGNGPSIAAASVIGDYGQKMG